MEKKSKKMLFLGLGFLLAFIIWTVLVRLIDVKTIGPNNSSVGFSSLNKSFHNLFGVSMPLYVITDWLGLVPLFIVLGFAILGVVQWIKRRNLLSVDKSILALGVYYIVVIGIYILFEIVIINYRPILINGCLEPSYPSSTTMLVACVMPTAMMQFKARIKNKLIKRFIIFNCGAFVAFMIIARLLSGVHWLTDIIGGILFSIGIVLIYYFYINIVEK